MHESVENDRTESILGLFCAKIYKFLGDTLALSFSAPFHLATPSVPFCCCRAVPFQLRLNGRTHHLCFSERIYYDRWQCQNICVSGKCVVLKALNPRSLRQGAHVCSLGGRVDDAVLDLRPGRQHNYEGELMSLQKKP